VTPRRHAAASRRGTRTRPPRTLRRVDGAVVDATEAEDEAGLHLDDESFYMFRPSGNLPSGNLT